jgi:hypothetical protein
MTKAVRQGWGRGLLCGVVALALSSAALADEQWREFSYPEQRFLIHFPASPAVSTGHYEAVTGTGERVSVPATIYSVRRGKTDYRVTVANLANSAAEDAKALEHAANASRAGGTVGLDTPVSMANSSCGRYLGIERAGGVLDFVALFYNRDTKLLYDVRASVPPADQAEHGADAVHFQQSLSFLADPDAKPAAPKIFPENWQPFVKEGGFSIRFPQPPSVEQGSYRTEAGITVPATLYSLRQGETLYRVTAAHMWETEADLPDVAVDEASRLWAGQGAVTKDISISLMNGQCGRDIAVRRPDGGTASAKIFFPSSQHRLYLVEVAHGSGAAPAVDAEGWFRDSFVIAKPGDE